MTNQFIEVSIKGQIGYLQLNRPKVFNALNRSMIKEIVLELEAFDRNDVVKAIVISGNGKSFCSGADIDEMANDTSISLEVLNQFADWDRLTLIKKPIIGAVKGFVFGGGFELALSCDILIASENTSFAFPEVNIGVMPGAGGTQRLTKIIGKTKALEIIWLGEPIDAQEAKQLRIVNKVVTNEMLLEEATKFAQKLATKPPLSLRLIKESVEKAVDYSLYEGMQFERKNFYMLFSSEDQKEGMNAFVEKRKANFKGR